MEYFTLLWGPLHVARVPRSLWVSIRDCVDLAVKTRTNGHGVVDQLICIFHSSRDLRLGEDLDEVDHRDWGKRCSFALVAAWWSVLWMVIWWWPKSIGSNTDIECFHIEICGVAWERGWLGSKNLKEYVPYTFFSLLERLPAIGCSFTVYTNYHQITSNACRS